MKHTIFYFIFLFSLTNLFSQPLHTRNKKAVKLYQEGLKNYDYRDWATAINFFTKAIEKSPNFYEAYVLRGGCYENIRKYDAAIQDYEKAIALDKSFFPNLYLTTARLYYNTGQYEKALEYYTTFKNYNKNSPILTKRADEGIQKVQFALNQLKNPKPFNPQPLPIEINSVENSEYMPTLTVDEKQIIFTRLLSCESCPGKKQEDIYTSYFNNGKWTLAKPISDSINTPTYNEGAQTISSDGKYLFFTACNRPDGRGSCDIYVSTWNGFNWTKPRNLREINSPYWDSQPCLAADGKTLYFVSNRNLSSDKTRQQMDIFVTYLREDSTWSTPVPLPAPINTPDGNEMSPFIHPDNTTLYFSSNAHLSMGGFDIFFSKKINDSTWNIPVNLGYPINTYKDESFLYVSGNGEKAYFSRGNLKDSIFDIYYFDLYREAQPNPTTYFKGQIIDAKTKKPIQAFFELFSLDNNKLMASTFSDLQGEFLLPLPTGKQYALNVTAPNYLFYSEHFDLQGNNSVDSPFIKTVELQPIEKNTSFVLNNVFFDVDKYELKPQSYAELNKLVDFLKKNPTLKIEIQGHTDNTGTHEHNMKLSENRAKAVYDYLLSKGIHANRMSYKGYGETMPIDTNSTAEGRAKNRRTEIKIL